MRKKNNSIEKAVWPFEPTKKVLGTLGGSLEPTVITVELENLLQPVRTPPVSAVTLLSLFRGHALGARAQVCVTGCGVAELYYCYRY